MSAPPTPGSPPRWRIDWHKSRYVAQILAAFFLLGVAVVTTDRANRTERQNRQLMERIPTWTPAEPSAKRPLAVQCKAQVVADGRTRQCRNKTRNVNGYCRVHGGR